MLPWLAVMFGGILGNGNPEADRMSTEIVAAVRERVDISTIKIPPKQLAAITHHSSGSREIVAKLHVDGLIGGELIDHDGTLTLRLVVYGGDGGMRSLSEITLKNRALGFGDFAAIRSNLSDEALALAPKPAPRPAPVVAKVAPRPEPEPEIEMEPASAAPPPEVADASPAVDDEPSPIEAVPEAITASAPTEEDEDPALGLRVGAGLGFVARNFAPGPATVPGYSASPVGAVSFTAQIQPAKRLCLDLLVDRTLSMSTPMGDDMATTSMSRWEASADYSLHTGRVTVASRVGLGRRAFTIESNVAGRTPDSDYNYLILGAAASAALGHSVSLHGFAAFEPVLWGTEPTEMAFGEARRWAVDFGAALEIRPRAHMFARVAADLQRFAWSWEAGDRGAGGAVDLFPSAMASVGAAY
jgi:hypothetical protein